MVPVEMSLQNLTFETIAGIHGTGRDELTEPVQTVYPQCRIRDQCVPSAAPETASKLPALQGQLRNSKVGLQWKSNTPPSYLQWRVQDFQEGYADPLNLQLISVSPRTVPRSHATLICQSTRHLFGSLQGLTQESPSHLTPILLVAPAYDFTKCFKKTHEIEKIFGRMFEAPPPLPVPQIRLSCQITNCIGTQEMHSRLIRVCNVLSTSCHDVKYHLVTWRLCYLLQPLADNWMMAFKKI